jgi:hypothetical protein
MTPEKIEELKTKHGTVRVCETAAGTLVLRKPTRQEFKKFQIAMNSGDASAASAAEDNYFLDTVVSHTREEAAALLDSFPGVVNDRGVVQALKELSGQAVSFEGKG